MPPEDTTPAPAKKRRIQLIPEQGGQIEVGGQKLSRIRRVVVSSESTEPGAAAEGEPAPAPTSRIDEIARKHLSPDQARRVEENSTMLELAAEAATPAAEHEFPPLEDIVSRVDVFNEGESAVPPSEADRNKREGMTVSAIVVNDDAPDFLGQAPPRTLWDLFALFPQLDGVSWFINVERKVPKLFGGISCAGMLHPITRAITLQEWADFYGGGQYTLQVYGPPKRAGYVLGPDGRAPPKALTEPITVTFPGHPSMDSMAYEEEDYEEPNMTGMPHPMHPMHRRGPATIADSKIVEVENDAALKREERQDNKEERHKNELLRAAEERNKVEQGVAQQIAAMARESAVRESEFRRELLDAQERAQRALEEQREKFEEKLETLANKKPERDPLEMLVALKNLSSGDENAASQFAAMRKDHAYEVERMQKQISEEHERGVRLSQEASVRADRLIEEEKRRAAERVTEVEQKAQERLREMQQRTDSEIQKAKDEAERRLNDLHRQNEQRIADESRNHQRDIEALKSNHTMQLESLKGTFEMRLETTRGEVKRVTSDAERFRLEAESNKDVVSKIQEIKDQAEALGMTEGGNADAAPETTGQMLMKMGMGLAGNLPGLVENFSNMLQARNSSNLEAARAAGRQDMINQAGGGGFAPTHQLPPPDVRPRAFQSMHDVREPPLVPGHGIRGPQRIQPPAPIPVPVAAPFEPEVQVSHAPLDYAAPEPPPRASVPPPPSPSVAPGPGPGLLPPPPEPSPAEAQALDTQIMQVEPLLRSPFEQGVEPATLAQDIISQVGKEQAAGMLQQLGSADRISLAVTRTGSDSPFGRRSGRKYLETLFAEIARLVR